MDLLDRIADERRRVADLIDDLDEAELSTPSLCGEWDVRDVAGHLLMPLVTPLPVVMVEMARSRFDFDKANVRLTARMRDRSPSELAERLREKARHPFKPPGFPHEAPLTDLIVHTQDMARPVGRDVEAPPESLRICLDFVATPKGAKLAGRVPDGVRLEADDLDWTYGDGPIARGRGIDLLMAMTRRTGAAEALEGPGAEVLAAKARRES